MTVRRVALLTLALLAPLPASADCVVLLHGLARGTGSMKPLEWLLRHEGYRVVNHGYPSTEAPVEVLAETITAAVADCGDQRVHFVTHSMGGILLRVWLTRQRPLRMGRVVMLAPPNQGSELVDVLGDWAAFGWLNGPAGAQLGTGPGSLPRALPPVTVPVGVIAGSLSSNPLSARLLPGPDDGKVSVAATHVAGQADHLTVPITHTFIMDDPRVMRQAVAFLRGGAFSR